MLIITCTNGTTYNIQEATNIFGRTYNMRGYNREAIQITIPQQEGVTYETLVEAFSDGASIMREETTYKTEHRLVSEGTETEPPVYETVQVPEVNTYDLTKYMVAGDIIDKRDGTFEVYMGVKTEAEQLNEELAMALLLDAKEEDTLPEATEDGGEA